jgi:hypothetical protein
MTVSEVFFAIAAFSSSPPYPRARLALPFSAAAYAYRTVNAYSFQRSLSTVHL